MQFKDSVNTSNSINHILILSLRGQSQVGAKGTISALLMR